MRYLFLTVPLYRFDVDENLELLPLAARRAADAAGVHLSREGWKSLPLEARRRLVELGSAETVNAEAVIEIVREARPEATVIAVVSDPEPSSVPTSVRSALGKERPVSDAGWAALSALDRYALVKVAERGREERIHAAYDEIVGHSAVSSHIAPQGGVRMVGVSQKEITARTAVAETRVTMNAEAFERLASHSVPKGDVLSTAKIAGIMAAKKTGELIPLCHPISISRADVTLSLDAGARSVAVRATVEAVDRTGVEMEALVAASVAALTVYDMLKSIDRAMTIGPTRLTSKTGGRSGDFKA